MLERNPAPVPDVELPRGMVWSDLVDACRRGTTRRSRRSSARARRAYALAFRLVRARFEAEDVVQEGVPADASLDASFREEANVGTWMHRIVTDVAIIRLRTKGRVAELWSDEVPASAIAEEDLADEM
jgi:DNA-directed RNA polymerase specialized sigma24 family protein